MTNDLVKQTWDMLIEQAGLDPEMGDLFYDDLIHRYNEPQRAYHTLDHIESLISRFHDFMPGGAQADRFRFNDPIAVGFAIFFHDIVYEVDGSVDNEGMSAEHARLALMQMGASDKLAERVRELVLITKTHKPGADDQDAAVFMDMDMEILAVSPDEYQAYSGLVRAEYAWVPDDIFAQHRAAFLRTTLDGGPIFHSAIYIEDGAEERARANMACELMALENPGAAPVFAQ